MSPAISFIREPFANLSFATFPKFCIIESISFCTSFCPTTSVIIVFNASSLNARLGSLWRKYNNSELDRGIWRSESKLLGAIFVICEVSESLTHILPQESIATSEPALCFLISFNAASQVSVFVFATLANCIIWSIPGITER